jgi:hypothetical protein
MGLVFPSLFLYVDQILLNFALGYGPTWYRVKMCSNSRMEIVKSSDGALIGLGASEQAFCENHQDDTDEMLNRRFESQIKPDVDNVNMQYGG